MMATTGGSGSAASAAAAAATGGAGGVRDWLKSWPAVLANLEALETQLRRREISGAQQCAHATVHFLRRMIGTCRWANAGQLMAKIKETGEQLERAQPAELTVGNIVRRVLFIIREEYASKLREQAGEEDRPAAISSGAPSGGGSGGGSSSSRSSSSGGGDGGGGSGSGSGSGSSNSSKVATEATSSTAAAAAAPDGTPIAAPGAHLAQALNLGPAPALRRMESLSRADSVDPTKQPSLGSMLSTGGDALEQDFSVPIAGLRQCVIDGIGDLVEELEGVHHSICDQALEHIHADEVILTYGRSTSVQLFLRTASKKRRFSVIVAESEPTLAGREMANDLSQHGIPVTFIPDSSIFAIMARVNKVIIPCHAIMADGGLIAKAGCHMVALAAQESSVPVVCVTGIYKLCPLFPHNNDIFNNLLSPEDVITYDSDVNNEQVEFVVPEFDHIAPDLVSLYVTNIDCHTPLYVYRLLAELYDPADTVLSKP